VKLINVKLRMRGSSSKYRKMISTDEIVFDPFCVLVESSYDYSPDAAIQNGEWFRIPEFSQKEYAIDLVKDKLSSVDFDSFQKADFDKIDFIFVEDGETLFFQRVTKSKLVKKKRIISMGENYKFQTDSSELIINEYPDAIYDKASDVMYFRRLESITSIFKGIEELYREATIEETEQFLKHEFIGLKEGYDASCIKTNNRKRIAMAMKTLSEMEEHEKENIIAYIAEYCPELKSEGNAFLIGSEDELKMLLFGIEQRYYTTIVGGEKRLANSVVPIK